MVLRLIGHNQPILMSQSLGMELKIYEYQDYHKSQRLCPDVLETLMEYPS